MGSAWGVACCVLEGRWVFVCMWMWMPHWYWRWHRALLFGQRGPLCVPSAPEQEPRRSGRRFKSNKLLQHFRDGIWRYQHAEPGRGWPIALPTRPWELPLPRLCWGDLCQCRALKYHRSAPPPHSLFFLLCLRFTPHQTDSMTHTDSFSYYPLLFLPHWTKFSKS